MFLRGGFNPQGIINCQPQEQSGGSNVVLQTAGIQSAENFQKALNNIQITPIEVKILVVNLNQSKWDEHLAQLLSSYLEQLENLQELDLNLANGDITNDHLQQIMSALTSLKAVEKFVLHISVSPQLHQGYLRIIFNYLVQTKSHKFIKIHNGVNESNGNDFKVISDLIIRNSILEELNFQSFENSYDEEAHSYICQGLSKNTHLRSLILQTIKEPPKFWDLLIENISSNASLENLFVRFLGGCNERKLAVGLNKIYKTVSPVVITVNTTHPSMSNFRELQQAKRETQLVLATFQNYIKQELLLLPQQVAVDLYFD